MLNHKITIQIISTLAAIVVGKYIVDKMNLDCSSDRFVFKYPFTEKQKNTIKEYYRDTQEEGADVDEEDKDMYRTVCRNILSGNYKYNDSYIEIQQSSDKDDIVYLRVGPLKGYVEDDEHDEEMEEDYDE